MNGRGLFPINSQAIYEKVNSFKNLTHNMSEDLLSMVSMFHIGLSIKESEIEYVADCINSILVK